MKDRNKKQTEVADLGLLESDINKSAAWEEFMLGVDPAWHEYKGPIKQDD